MMVMSFEPNQHPRVAAGNGTKSGQFTEKQRDAATVNLTPAVTAADVRYTLHHTNGDGKTAYVEFERGTSLNDVLEFALAFDPSSELQLSADVTSGPQNREMPLPRGNDTVAVARVGDDYIAMSDLHGRGMTLFNVDEIIADKKIRVPSADSGDPVELDNVRQWLGDSPGDGPSTVELIRSDDDDETANLEISTYENFLWFEDEFTPEELDANQDIVEEVYAEWFGASLYSDGDWRSTHVTITTQLPVAHATELLALERAWGPWAKFRNETDPGTFGSPYVGAEIRKRIDERARSAA